MRFKTIVIFNSRLLLLIILTAAAHLRFGAAVAVEKQSAISSSPSSPPLPPKCSLPFTNNLRGNSFGSCIYIAGSSTTYHAAPLACGGFGSLVLTVRKEQSLKELASIYKSNPNYFIWLGATANATDPRTFHWQDGTKVNQSYWCSGHPKGGDHLCSYYTQPLLFGGNGDCFYSSKCDGTFFKHSIVCQQHKNSTTKNAEEHQTGKDDEEEEEEESSNSKAAIGMSSEYLDVNYSMLDRSSSELPLPPEKHQNKYVSYFNNRCICEGCTDIMHNAALCQYCCQSIRDN